MAQTPVVEVDYMTNKKSRRSIFGRCLLQLRQQKGWTQMELAKKVRLSRRMIAHYERHGERIPVNHLTSFANVFNVSVDLFVGLKPIKMTTSLRTARLFNRLHRVEELPDKDRKAVLDYIDALLLKAGIVKP